MRNRHSKRKREQPERRYRGKKAQGTRLAWTVLLCLLALAAVWACWPVPL